MLVLTALNYFYYREGEGESERGFCIMCVRTYVLACVSERLIVTFVFIDEVFGGCVCV